MQTGAHRIIYKINIVQLVFFLSSLIVIKFIDKKYRKNYIFAILVSIICVILSLVPAIWKIMPKILCNIQFPWRLFGFFGFFMSSIASINVYIILKKIFKDKPILFIAIPIALFSLIYAYTLDYPMDVTSNSDETKTNFIYDNIDNIKYENINKDYFPLNTIQYLSTDTERVSGDSAIVLEGEAEIVDQEKDNLKYEIKFSSVSQGAKIEIPFLYYAGYKAYIIENDTKIPVAVKESEVGFLEIESPIEFGECTLIVEYNTPVSYYIVYIISSISLILFITYIVFTNKKNKKI